MKKNFNIVVKQNKMKIILSEKIQKVSYGVEIVVINCF